MKNLRFLVIDDSETARMMVIKMLRRLAECVIFEAENGKEALFKMFTQDIDFIITDWNMPEMNGLDFVKAIRRVPDFDNVPILMITSRSDKHDILDAMKAHVNDYVIKPYTIQVLKEKIERLIKK